LNPRTLGAMESTLTITPPTTTIMRLISSTKLQITYHLCVFALNLYCVIVWDSRIHNVPVNLSTCNYFLSTVRITIMYTPGNRE
jgi:hypothetical protein